MDPLSFDTLLSICDELDTAGSVDSDIALETFNEIVRRQSRARDLNRRSKDILRVLQEMGWFELKGQGAIRVHPQFVAFVSAWERSDYLSMNGCVTMYRPYARFLDCLKAETKITLPARSNKAEKQELNNWLQAKYQITYVAFDTFRFWATALAVAHLSPVLAAIFWGGDWDELIPDLPLFRETLLLAFKNADRSSGYANVGWIADSVCRQLRISFQAFESKVNVLVKTYPSEFTFATATARPPTKHYTIPFIRPRSVVKLERARADMLRGSPLVRVPRWLEYRYLEDGVLVGGRLVRLIRREGLT